MKKRIIGLILAGVLALSSLAGCGKDASGEKAAGEEGAASNEEVVTLKWYMNVVDNVDPDTEMVIEELNKYTREKIGVEIEYYPMIASDYAEKMPNLVSSGEYFDICFTSNSALPYVDFVNLGAFADMTELVQEYAPETYEFIPEDVWEAAKVKGSLYAVPVYKSMGTQGNIEVNSDMAEEYGIDLTKIKTLEDFGEALKIVKEKSEAEGKDVIGAAGLRFSLLVPFESLSGAVASPISAYDYFEGEEEVMNVYDTQEFMDYCNLVHEWYLNGYLGADPVNYASESSNAQIQDDFYNGKLFARFLSSSPGYKESEEAASGHGVEIIPLYDPVFTTERVYGGMMAISANSKYPEKAMEFINLLNSDLYVGTLIRHGIEGVHYTAVGDDRVDITLGGTVDADENGYTYTYGWQFGTIFNQKWDISYPDDVADQYMERNIGMKAADHAGFVFDTENVTTELAALSNVIEEYLPMLQTGMVDPQQYIPEFVQKLEANGIDVVMEEGYSQIEAWRADNK